MRRRRLLAAATCLLLTAQDAPPPQEGDDVVITGQRAVIQPGFWRVTSQMAGTRAQDYDICLPDPSVESALRLLLVADGVSFGAVQCRAVGITIGSGKVKARVRCSGRGSVRNFGVTGSFDDAAVDLRIHRPPESEERRRLPFCAWIEARFVRTAYPTG